jgi:hypothetical protein
MRMECTGRTTFTSHTGGTTTITGTGMSVSWHVT